ncbi:protein phosphatase 2C domain-containing protein [Methylobacterium sp. 37f]|uniref:PP2C family protein-serine/threonine phosphatase n=1 Tax=Methylobacterium sp. 37f TaxID=2817058 RepID=UPI001FFDDB0A|nr:protein phosphatase 2C domain-containing protein [Methylobacterium sp. 37f]MCK2056104.1 serine/threonine-protein phosphatase [Methylobacterium sp. 37f]
MPLTDPSPDPDPAVGGWRAAYGAATHAGRVRELNEDRFLLGPGSGVFAVADGMGGHDAGEVASGMVVDSLATVGAAVTPQDLRARVEERLLRANAAIHALAEQNGKVSGSVVAVLLTFEGHFACLWSGDSRVYHLRGRAIAQLTRDHTEVQHLLDNGLLTEEEARVWPRRNVITQAIGVRPEPELAFLNGVIAPGDAFVVCSDGLTAHAEADDILRLADGQAPQAACDALVALALERGGQDNVTVVVVRFDSDTSPEPGSRAADAVEPPEGRV